MRESRKNMEKVRMYDVCVVKLGDHKLLRVLCVCVYFFFLNTYYIYIYIVSSVKKVVEK